jgi:hypothetical protein
MAAAPDDDARKTLAELEAKLRELERELLRGRDPDPPPLTDARAPEPLPEEPATVEPEAFPESADAPEPLPAEPAAPLAGQRPTAEPPAGDPLHAEPPPPPTVEPPALQPEPFPEPAQPPLIEPEPLPTVDLAALADARHLLDDLRATIDGLGGAAGRVTTEARAIVDDHSRTLARLDLAAQAAARAEQAAVEAGRIAGTVVIEAGPFADPRALIELRDALAARPEARDAYVRGIENGRAVIEVHLVPPPTA